MKILVYLGHPAQYYFFKNAVQTLRNNEHHVQLVIKSKDVLETLLRNDQREYTNILAEGRKTNKSGILWGLIKRDFRLLKIALKFRPELLLGSDPTLAHVGKLLGLPVITTLEDDYDVIPSLAKLTYPFTTNILVPTVCSVGKWNSKKIGYEGYMKLAYLHPNYFDNNKNEHSQQTTKKILIRTSKLDAHHDFGISGLNLNLLNKLIKKYQKDYEIFISSETKILESHKDFALNIQPNKIHSFLSGCQLLISDSQSMSMEAAMLGVPSVRFSDFARKISVLEELEKKYSLTFGFKTNQQNEFLAKINELLTTVNLSSEFQKRRRKMLSEKIDVTAFMVWFIENYPASVKILSQNPDYQYNFR